MEPEENHYLFPELKITDSPNLWTRKANKSFQDCLKHIGIGHWYVLFE